MESHDEKMSRLIHVKEDIKRTMTAIATLKADHMRKSGVLELIHEYNDIKDAAQTVFGEIAGYKNCTVAKVHEEYGLDTKD